MTPGRKAFNAAWDEGKAQKRADRHAHALDCYARALTLLDVNDFIAPGSSAGQAATTARCALWSDIASARCAQGDLAAALEAIERSIALPVEYKPTSFYNRGVILTRLGRYEEALASFDQAIASLKSLFLLPPVPAGDYFFGRGEALEGLGLVAAAVDTYECALPLGQGGVLHREAKARLRALGRKIPKATAPRWPSG